MQLSEWLKLRGKTARDLAETIDVTPMAVSRYISGERWPRRSVMEKITKVTGGAVTANDFLSRSEGRVVA